MIKTRVCILAFFATGMDTADGQSVKTLNLTNALKEDGRYEIFTVDTTNWKKSPFKLFLNVIKALRKCNAVIMLPAHNGLKVFSRLLYMFKKKNTKLYYDVIGGWLADYLKANKRISSILKKFDGIFVETESMQNALEKQGFNNVTVVPNFKDIKPLREDELVFNENKPFKFCTFSRVVKEKGIEDAVNAITEVNREYGETVCTLDIYGSIDENYKEEFETLKSGFPEFVSYKGVISPEKSVETVKNYFALLFPTYYDGEGFAGTLLDAMFAGVPVIASDWKYNSEIIIDNYSGGIFATGDFSNFVEHIKFAVNSTKDFNKLKLNCLKKAEEFSKETAIKKINELIR